MYRFDIKRKNMLYYKKKDLQEVTTMEKLNSWTKLNKNDVMTFCDGYIDYLNASKTERLAVATSEKLAKEAEKHGWEHPKLRELTKILKKELASFDGQTKLQSTRFAENEDEKSFVNPCFLKKPIALLMHSNLISQASLDAYFFISSSTAKSIFVMGI